MYLLTGEGSQWGLEEAETFGVTVATPHLPLSPSPGKRRLMSQSLMWATRDVGDSSELTLARLPAIFTCTGISCSYTRSPLKQCSCNSSNFIPWPYSWHQKGLDAALVRWVIASLGNVPMVMNTTSKKATETYHSYITHYTIIIRI